MCEGGPPSAEAPKQREEPATRVGADDPFETIDLDDPLGVKATPKADPYAQDDPTQRPTRNLGLPVPPPVPPSTPADPAGRGDLRQGTKAVQDRISALEAAEAAAVDRLTRTVRAGRNALGEHWQRNVDMTLARRSARMDPADAGVADLFKKLQASLGRHQSDIVGALGDWCRARDAVPCDEAGLASAMDRARNAIDALRAEFPSGEEEVLGSAIQDDSRLIAILCEAVLAQLADEGTQIAEGQRVPRTASGDGLSGSLLAQTADSNLRNRLEQRAKWSDTAVALQAMIGANTLGTAITANVGKVDLSPAKAKLAQLDQSLRARKAAPSDYQARADVLQGYLGAVDLYSTALAAIRRGAGEIAAKKKGGWSADKAREAADMVAGMLRHIQAEMATDPLVEDPDLAGAARKAISSIDAITGRTSLEVAADGLGTDLRQAWKQAKASELKALKNARVDTSALSGMFDSGLGPALDTWATEIAKFPRHNRATLKSAANDAALALARYRTAVETIAGPERSSRLVLAIDSIAAAMARQISSFDQRGGLF